MLIEYLWGRIALLLIIGSMLMGVAAPAAEAYPVTHNQRGSHVPLKYGPTNAGNTRWIPNTYRTWYGSYINYKFRMMCFSDFQWYTGNYSSNRWFYGQTFWDGSYMWVHSSYVWYQWAVPRC